tara:strand:- start:329 stop:1765 length:1437 start_codon:yes stop_codon:yes gene_type:complete
METLQRTANRGSVSTGFDIDNSLKLEEDNTEYLHFTPSSQTDYERMAFSIWIKRTELNNGSGATRLAEFGNGTANTTNLRILFDSNDKLGIYGNSIVWRLSTQSFRDTSAWYHLFFKFDTTQGTSNDRIRVWVNGQMIAHTDYDTVNNPGSGTAMGFNRTNAQTIGQQQEGGVIANNGFNGYIAQAWGSGGTPPDVTDFGEYDTNGIWIPKDISALSIPDSNGFFLDFSDSSDLGNDSSSNNNDFTLNNITSADQATDVPTNNFCTFNELMGDNNAPTITEGATKVTGGGGTWNRAFGTQGVKNGKWYYEVKIADSTDTGYYGASTTPAENSETQDAQLMYNTSFIVGSAASIDYYYWQNGSQVSNESTGWGSLSTNDVIGIALDLDSSTKTFTIYKNGSALSGTLSQPVDLPTNMQDEFIFPMVVQYEDSDDQYNLGGYTTSTISSAATDENGYGNFEYAPPSGYYALCTKNIAEYG